MARTSPSIRLAKRRRAATPCSNLVVAVTVCLSLPRLATAQPPDDSVSSTVSSSATADAPDTNALKLGATAIGLVGFATHQAPAPRQPNISYAHPSGPAAGLRIGIALPARSRWRPTLSVGLDYSSSFLMELDETTPDQVEHAKPLRSHQLAANVAGTWALFPRRSWLHAGLQAGYAHEQLNSHIDLPFDDYSGRGFSLGLRLKLGRRGGRAMLTVVPDLRRLWLDERSLASGYADTITLLGVAGTAQLRVWRAFVIQAIAATSGQRPIESSAADPNRRERYLLVGFGYDSEM